MGMYLDQSRANLSENSHISLVAFGEIVQTNDTSRLQHTGIDKKFSEYQVLSCDFETESDISFVDSKIHKCYIEHVKLNLTYPTQWRSL